MADDQLRLTIIVESMVGDQKIHIEVDRNESDVIIKFTSPPGEILHEDVVNSDDRLFRVFIHECDIKPETYKFPLDSLPISIEGLDGWEKKILPLFMGENDNLQEKGFINGHYLLTLDDWHLKALSDSIGNIYDAQFEEQCQDFQNAVEILELNDEDVNSMLERYRLKNNIDFWAGLVSKLNHETSILEKVDELKQIELDKFYASNKEFFENALGEKGHGYWSGVNYSIRSREILNYAYEYFMKHKLLPHGKHSIQGSKIDFTVRFY